MDKRETSGLYEKYGQVVADMGLPGPDAGKGGTEDELAQRVTLPVSKAAIASRLSMTPEYFSRVLHELEAKGLIVIDKRDIHIPDPQRLTRYPVD